MLGGEPEIVQEAKYRPGKCLASGDTEGPFIDAGRWTREHDPYVQLSVRWIEEVAQKLLGMVSKTEIDERYSGLEEQIAEQAKRIKALERFEEAAAEYEEARQAVTVEPIRAETITAETIRPAKTEFSQDDVERERVEREAGGIAA